MESDLVSRLEELKIWKMVAELDVLSESQDRTGNFYLVESMEGTYYPTLST